MKLNQVTLPTTDLTAAKDFYQTLGLELIVDAPPHYARFLCPEGGSTFSVHLVDEVVPHDAVTYFECADLDERVAALTQKGILFDTPPTDQRWRWREAELRDPDGNRLKLYWGGEDRINPPWRVGR